MTAAALVVALGVIALLGPIGRRPPRIPTPSTPATRPPHTEDGRRARRWWSGGALLATLVVLGPWMTAAIAASVVCRPRVRRLRAERARLRTTAAAFPDAVEMLVLVVHAGLTPHQAITVLATRAPAPVRPAFVEVRRRVGRGATLADALGALPELLGPMATSVADTLALAERHGTPIARAVEQLSTDVRESRRRRAEADARTLPVRMSFPLVACTLPSFVLIAIVPAVLAALSSLADSGF